MLGQYRAFSSRLLRYFRAFGGWRAILFSPIFNASIIVSLISYEAVVKYQWVQSVQSILPNLLGFSLGTYSVVFGIITPKLKTALKEVKNNDGITYFDEIGSTFFHYIFIQSITIIYSFVFSSNIFYEARMWLIDEDLLIYVWFICSVRIISLVLSFIGMTMLCYSILLVIAAALAVFRISSIVVPDGDA